MYIKTLLISAGLFCANAGLANADLDVVETNEDSMDLEEYYDMMDEDFEIRAANAGGFNSLYGFGQQGYNNVGRSHRYPARYLGGQNYNGLFNFKGGMINNRALNYGAATQSRPAWQRQNRNYSLGNMFGASYGQADKKYSIPRTRFNYNHQRRNQGYNRNIPWFPTQQNYGQQTIYR